MFVYLVTIYPWVFNKFSVLQVPHILNDANIRKHGKKKQTQLLLVVRKHDFYTKFICINSFIPKRLIWRTVFFSVIDNPF